jgi:hypothetical protein
MEKKIEERIIVAIPCSLNTVSVILLILHIYILLITSHIEFSLVTSHIPAYFI